MKISPTSKHSREMVPGIKLRGVTYLGSAYSHQDPAVKEERFRLACKAAARLMQAGFVVFAPIPHSHSIEQLFDDKEGHAFWMGQDLPLLKAARQMIVLTFDGWKQSKGLAEEIQRATGWDKPVAFIGMEALQDDYYLDALFAFWERVDVRTPAECWPWVGAYCNTKDKDAYGRFTFGGKFARANRMTLEFVDGKRPDDLLACHTCDNPRCVSPWHLYWGTAKDNVRDMVERGRAKPSRGERQWSAKFSDAEISEIRRLRASGVPLKNLSAKFGISESHACSVTKGVWRKTAP